MPEELQETYYDDARADVETAVYAYATLCEMDLQLLDKQSQRELTKAKNDCVFIICKALGYLREGYE